MRIFCILLLITAIVMVTRAKEVLQVELEWSQGAFQKVSETIIEKR